MAEKTINNLRIINKHDTEENWLKATGFTPKQGELIVYDVDANYDYERIKIGDGVQNVNSLPFADDAVRSSLMSEINAVDDKVDAIGALIGDTSVSEQINTAIESHEYSWNDLTDRPFYKVAGEYITIIEEQTVTNGATVTGEALSPGTEYIVTVNGVDYTRTSSYSVESGTTYISISDPYVRIESNDGLTVKTSGDSVVLSVKVKGEDTIVTIPEEYLPSTLVKGIDGVLPNSSGMVDLLASKSFYIDRDYTGTSMRDILNSLSVESYRYKGYVYNNLQENSNAYQGLVVYADTYGGLDYTHRFILLNKLGGIKVFLVDTDADTININGGVGAIEIQGDLASTSYVDSAIAAIPTPDVSGQIETHNTSETAHSDIRTAISDVSALVGDTKVSDQIGSAISNQDVATSSEKGLMSADDKALLDNFRYTNLGSMKDKTIADLRTALEEWLNTVHSAPNAIAIFSSSEFISLWNVEDTTTTLSSGATWTVELKTFYQNGTYALLEICNYYYKAAYYVAITNSTWTEIRKVFFDSDNIVYVGPTQPTDPNIKVWINTAEEGTGVVPVLPRVSTITLPTASWAGSASPYSQTVSINTVTSATKIDLQPTVAQIVDLQNADIALMAENIDGVVTIYSFGGKPSSDMTMQVLLTEVSYV